MIPLANASAVDVALTVNRLFAEAGAGAGRRGRHLAAPQPWWRTRARTAWSCARTTRRASPALRTLVAMLDSPTSAAGNLHVVYLKNAEAVKVAETLRAIYLGESVARGRARAMAVPAARRLPAGAPPAVAARAAAGAAGRRADARA